MCKVHLISATPSPRNIIKFCWDIINSPGFPKHINNYTSETNNAAKIVPGFETNNSFGDETREFLKSGLSGPLEMIHFVFGFEGVTRAFTHQIVRTRLASYMQQSQRFTEFKDGLHVHKPSNIDNWTQKSEDGSTAEEIWDACVKNIEWSCQALQIMNIPTQDIRGLYPTNIKTNIIQSISYSALRHMLSHRLCTQAQQDEWGSVAQQIKAIVTQYDPILGEALQPACVVTGRCAFDTVLDRDCPIRKNLKLKIGKEELIKIMSLISKDTPDEELHRILGDDLYIKVIATQEIAKARDEELCK